MFDGRSTFDVCTHRFHRIFGFKLAWKFTGLMKTTQKITPTFSLRDGREENGPSCKHHTLWDTPFFNLGSKRPAAIYLRGCIYCREKQAGVCALPYTVLRFLESLRPLTVLSNYPWLCFCSFFGDCVCGANAAQPQR